MRRGQDPSGIDAFRRGAMSQATCFRFGVSVIWKVAVLIKNSIGRSAWQATSTVVR